MCQNFRGRAIQTHALCYQPVRFTPWQGIAPWVPSGFSEVCKIGVLLPERFDKSWLIQMSCPFGAIDWSLPQFASIRFVGVQETSIYYTKKRADIYDGYK